MTPINEVARTYAGLDNPERQRKVYKELLNLFDTKDESVLYLLEGNNVVLFQGYEYRVDGFAFGQLLELLARKGL